jgi:hypothetical protein
MDYLIRLRIYWAFLANIDTICEEDLVKAQEHDDLITGYISAIRSSFSQMHYSLKTTVYDVMHQCVALFDIQKDGHHLRIIYCEKK